MSDVWISVRFTEHVWPGGHGRSTVSVSPDEHAGRLLAVAPSAANPPPTVINAATLDQKRALLPMMRRASYHVTRHAVARSCGWPEGCMPSGVQAAWTLAQALYLFSPLLVSVALSALVHRYDLGTSWKVPIDGGRTFGGTRIFGDSKTWRGVAIAVVGSVATVSVQKHILVAETRALAVVDYALVSPIVFGTVMGLAAMAGELPNSFVKRRLGIAPGSTTSRPALRVLFWVWDQVDLLTLSWPALLPWVHPTLGLVVASFVLALVIHPLVAALGFLLGARKTAR